MPKLVDAKIRKKSKKRRAPPDWLLRIGRWSAEARTEICVRGGRNSIGKLLEFNEVQRVLQKNKITKRIEEDFQTRLSCNEHVVPIDDTCSEIEIVDESPTKPLVHRPDLEPPF